VTFTVPDDGSGDTYDAVEIVDTGTGHVFAELTWDGSAYTGSAVISGTTGDVWVLEARKRKFTTTRSSDNSETISVQ
jgi:hypothetical protein